VLWQKDIPGYAAEPTVARIPGTVVSRRSSAGRTDAAHLRRLVHSVDSWSKLKSRSFVLVVWLGAVGSLIWFLGSLVTDASSVYLALISLFLFGGVAIAAVLYDTLLVPYIRNTDRGMSGRGAAMELLVTAAEMALAVTIGSLGEAAGASSDASGPGLSGGGGSFGGGGATGHW
jgi:uncharacterized membrane protein YgcG